MTHIPLLLITLIVIASPLQLYLTKPRTCLGFEVEEDGDKLLFTYHHNPNLGTANFIIYGLNNEVLAESGKGADYKTFLEVQIPQKGEMQMCFEKDDGAGLEVHFDVVRQEEQIPHAGRQDLGKMTRRIGQFLVEIKKTGLEYKEVLSQHNSRHERLKEYESRNMIIYVLKVGVMISILGAQVWAIRKIFE